MANEYGVENKEYFDAVRDLKASIFDVVVMAIESTKVDTAVLDENSRESYRQLLDQQSTCLKNALQATNELTESLARMSHDLQGVSTDVEKNIGEEQAENVADNEQANMNAVEVELPNVELSNDNAVSTEVTPSESVLEENVAIAEAAPVQVPTVGVVNDNIVSTEAIPSEVASEGDAAADMAPVQVSNVGVTSDSAVSTETTPSESVSEENVAVAEAVPVQVPNVGVTSDNVVSTETTPSESVPEENVVVDAAPVQVPTVGVVNDNVVSTEVTPSESVSEENVAVADVTSVQVPAVGVVNDNVVSAEVTPSEVVPVQGTQTSDVSAVSLADSDSANQEDNISADNKLKFVKETSDMPKAIITNKKQNANLRQSLPTQEALLNANNSGISTYKEVTEQQLIDKGLLEPTVKDKQEQIEQMLAQATSLYKAGKTDEAKAMYDKISVLNKELQASGETISR